jgi:hypothetical protein
MKKADGFQSCQICRYPRVYPNKVLGYFIDHISSPGSQQKLTFQQSAQSPQPRFFEGPTFVAAAKSPYLMLVKSLLEINGSIEIMQKNQSCT